MPGRFTSDQRTGALLAGVLLLWAVAALLLGRGACSAAPADISAAAVPADSVMLTAPADTAVHAIPDGSGSAPAAVMRRHLDEAF